MENIFELTKPARYTGGEFNSVTKNFDTVACRIALALPDVYEVGMSNLGLAILYSILNAREDTLCERVYSPWIDAEKVLRENNEPLFALESKRAIKDFDFLGFSLQYEMIYSNVLNMLDLAQIHLHVNERGEDEPFIIGGGPCVYNVEPVADFFDFFIVGEAEEVFGEVIETFIAWKNSGKSGGRRGFLKMLINISGIYVPAFYEPLYADGNFIGMKVIEPNAPKKILKRVVKDFDVTPTVGKPIVPFMEIVHDRAMLELFRGCSRGCRFCQAGMTYRPVRERKKETLRKIARRLIDSSGWDELSLTSLSSADYSCLPRLIDDLKHDFRNEKVSFSLPSLRIDSFSIELAEKVQTVRKSGLTFAPEAGTQRLRDVINKNVTEKNLLDACAAAFAKGWKTVKLYFMMGLPTETEDDIRGIADLAQKVADLYRSVKNRRDVKVTISVACFVPKPFTPFQWFAQISAEEFERRQQFLKSLIRDKAITYNYHNAQLSVLEGALARGDRRLSQVIETAWRNGAKFDGWSDLFKPEVWAEAFTTCNLDPRMFSGRTREFWEPLPWEHTSPGVDKSFLQSEWEKSQAEETTRDCRRTSCTGCGVCMNLGVKVNDFAKEKLPPSENLPVEEPKEFSLTKYRAQIRKGTQIAVLSHLDYMNLFMRALIRSKLPAAWSEGFNPHLKVSFATALAVGVTSDCEYVDFELTEPISESEVSRRLNEQLPDGAEILRLKKLRGKAKPVMSLVDMSRYEVKLPFDEKLFGSAQNSVTSFNAAAVIEFTRVTPKKTRELELKQYIVEPLKAEMIGGILQIKFGIKITPTGSVKPSEVLKILRERFNFPTDFSAAIINRTELLCGGKLLLDV
ncbi:MAG: TIGR03960 family B12-binding radical SAM protein [Selenomonadaceae bacterium]|nr:TIGR03960 family B12-binding radical SAM protein [Selenomonadaceae bacterium]